MDSQGNTLIMRDLPISMPHCIPPAVTYISGARVCGTKLRTVQFCCLPWTAPGEAQGCGRWLVHPGLAGHQHTPDTHIHTQRSALMPWGRGTPQMQTPTSAPQLSPHVPCVPVGTQPVAAGGFGEAGRVVPCQGAEFQGRIGRAGTAAWTLPAPALQSLWWHCQKGPHSYFPLAPDPSVHPGIWANSMSEQP